MNFGQARPPLWRIQAQKAVAGGFGANGAQQPPAGTTLNPYKFGSIPLAPKDASDSVSVTQGLAGSGSSASDMAKQAMMRMSAPAGSGAALTPMQMQQASQAKSMTQGMNPTQLPITGQQPIQQLQANMQGQLQQPLQPLQPLRPLQMQGPTQPRYNFGQGGF